MHEQIRTEEKKCSHLFLLYCMGAEFGFKNVMFVIYLILRETPWFSSSLISSPCPPVSSVCSVRGSSSSVRVGSCGSWEKFLGNPQLTYGNFRFIIKAWLSERKKRKHPGPYFSGWVLYSCCLAFILPTGKPSTKVLPL